MNKDGMNKDTLIQKVTSLQRCVARARNARERAGDSFAEEFDLQDAAVLNVIRACELAIDLANMWVQSESFGMPVEARDSFNVLAREKKISVALAERLKRMVGFRNIAVHQYRDLNTEIVKAVIQDDLDDLLEFARVVSHS